MNREAFDALVEQTYEQTARLLVSKGAEYASDEDRLANFRRGSMLTRLDPMQVALIYMAKHFDAVATYVANHANGALQVLDEPIEGRLHDLINYCYLMKALMKEGAR